MWNDSSSEQYAWSRDDDSIGVTAWVWSKLKGIASQNGLKLTNVT